MGVYEVPKFISGIGSYSSAHLELVHVNLSCPNPFGLNRETFQNLGLAWVNIM